MKAQTKLHVALKKLDPRAILPKYQTAGAAGADLYANVEAWNSIVIAPGETRKISTGVAVSIGDPGWAMHLLSRSGLASKGIVVANGVGLIDSDYQGELIVLLRNRTDNPFQVVHGDRIAQIEFVPVVQAEFTVVDDFSVKTERGAGGFGSTGVRNAQEVMNEAATGKPDIAEQMNDEEDGVIVGEPATLDGSAA
jgi:dUTP pyrophosphatase